MAIPSSFVGLRLIQGWQADGLFRPALHTDQGHEDAAAMDRFRELVAVAHHQGQPLLCGRAYWDDEASGVRQLLLQRLGYPAAAPFDAILVAAGAPRVPESLKQQLSDAGRLVIPIGTAAQQRLTLVVRQGDQFAESVHGGCVFVPLVGAEGWPE